MCWQNSSCNIYSFLSKLILPVTGYALYKKKYPSWSPSQGVSLFPEWTEEDELSGVSLIEVLGTLSFPYHWQKPS